MFIIQKLFIGQWDDVKIATDINDGLRLLKTCIGAKREHRLIERAETIIETTTGLNNIEKSKKEKAEQTEY